MSGKWVIGALLLSYPCLSANVRLQVGETMTLRPNESITVQCGEAEGEVIPKCGLELKEIGYTFNQVFYEYRVKIGNKVVAIYKDPALAAKILADFKNSGVCE